MAKRKKKPDVIIHERGNAGIIDNRTYAPLTEAGTAWLREHNDKTLLSRLDEMEQSLGEFLTRNHVSGKVDPVTGAENEITITVEVDHATTEHLSEPVRFAVEDAMWCIGMIQVVRRGIASGDASHAATYAFQLGMLWMKLDKVRPNE